MKERKPTPCICRLKTGSIVASIAASFLRVVKGVFTVLWECGKLSDLFSTPSLQSSLIKKTSPSTSLTTEEELMVKFIFDENCMQGESVIAMGLHSTNSVEIATRQHMCCLKPYARILTMVINLVVIQLTNKQRTKYPDGKHRVWYMPLHVSQMIIKNEVYKGNNERVADLYFKEQGYTGPIDALDEIDVVRHVAYLFDSKPSQTFGKDRKKKGELLVKNMHEVLKHAYGSNYVQDVSLYKVHRLPKQPLQLDNYNCGLFVIKYMQSAPLSPGFQMFDPIERRRLLVDLLKDVDNRRFLEFRHQFDMYNMR